MIMIRKLNNILRIFFFVVYISTFPIFSQDKRNINVDSLLTTALELQKKEDLLGFYSTSILMFDEGTEEHLICLNNIASIYFENSDYAKALEKYSEALEIAINFYGKEHLFYIQIKQSLATTYMSIDSKSSQALKMYLELEEEISSILGEKHTEYLTLKSNLALIYTNLSQYNEALQIYLATEKPIIDEFGENSVQYNTFQRNYAYLIGLLTGSTSEISSELKNLEQTKKIFGKTHLKYLVALNQVGVAYSNIQDFDKSIEYLSEAYEISNNIIDKYHERRLIILNNISESYFSKGEYSKGLSFIQEYQQGLRERFKIYEHSLNIGLRNSVYDELVRVYRRILYLSVSEGDINTITDQYSQHCFLKGRELSRINQTSSIVYNSNDDVLIETYNDFLAVNNQIAAGIELDLSQRTSEGLDLNYLQNYSDALERKLVRLSSVYEKSQAEYSIEDIRLKLNQNEAFVDIVELIIPYNGGKINNSFTGDLEHRYYAYIITKDVMHPLLIDLGSNDAFEKAFQAYEEMIGYKKSYRKSWRSNMTEKQISFNQFWGPIDPYIKGKSKIYFSNEGIYSKINLDVLYDTTDNTFIDDKVEIVYTSSAEDFIIQNNDFDLPKNSEDLSAVLIGNPKFLLSSTQIAPQQDSGIYNYDNVFTSISRGVYWNELPGTGIEIQNISNNLIANGWNVELVCCENATESYVKKINAPQILHVATHGFFSEDRSINTESGMISQEGNVINNPMVNSALVFAGAQNTSNDEILPFDNGLLNAYEASFLNLRGTELVVLSACETGLGDIQTGRGVYGLQRAMKIAGSESIIMSMWSVSDNSTQELMTYFYDFWINKNMTKRDAFDAAKKSLETSILILTIGVHLS